MSYIESFDPASGRAFFANPDTGDCQWDRPEDATIIPRNVDGNEWLQFEDSNSGQTYYYNTTTKETTWGKPTEGNFIPLNKLKRNTIGRQISEQFDLISPPIDSNVPISDEKNVSVNEGVDSNANYTTSTRESAVKRESSIMQKVVESSSSEINNEIEELSANEISADEKGEAKNEEQEQVEHHADTEVNDQVKELEEYKAVEPANEATELKKEESSDDIAGKPVTANFYPAPAVLPEGRTVGTLKKGTLKPTRSAPPIPTLSPATGLTENPEQVLIPVDAGNKADIVKAARAGGIGGPVLNKDAAIAMSPLKNEFISNTKKYETIKALPLDLKEDLEKFRINGFAKTYFAQHKSGILFKRKVPIEKMVIYQKNSLSAPLLNQLAKPLHKDALKCFKYIQKIQKTEIKSAVDDIYLLMEKGVLHGGLRDEIYVQICKQVTQNPSDVQTQRGWFLIGIIAIAFPPSKNFEDYLKSFINEHINDSDEKVAQYAAYALKNIIKICKKGPRGKTPSKQEIERAIEAPFTKQLFGETLEDIIATEREEHPDAVVPRILTFLSESIINLHGCNTEGIFRVPGDIDAVMDLRCRIEKNEFDLTGISDPNVPSSLLKLWLRELTEPLIPADTYDSCVKVALKDQSIEEVGPSALKIIDSLPEINRNVCYYVLKFLRTIGEPVNQKITKMTVANIAMVFAPNFVRCPSDNPTTIFENTKYEQAFIRILMTYIPTDQDSKEKLLATWEL